MIFTDNQIKSLTQSMCDYPSNLATLNDNLASAVASKSQWLDKDGANNVYTSDLLNIQAQYHEELRQMSSVSRTLYSTALIDPAARLLPGNLHFPTDPTFYLGFPPKMVDSNLGNPTGASTGTELESINGINGVLTLMNGFSSSVSVSDVCTVSSNVVTTSDSIWPVPNLGDKILATNSTDFIYGTVSGFSSAFGEYYFVLSVIYTSGASGPCDFTTYHSGFTISQLDNGISGGMGVYLNNLKNLLDVQAANWKSRINNTIAAIDANTATGIEATQKNAQKTLLQTHQATITAWQSYPYTGSGTSRFGSNKYILENDKNLRGTHISARTSEINGYLGALSQNPDGTYSGSGQYYELFKNLDARLNRVSGSLRNYYGIDMAVQAINIQIAALAEQNNRDSNTFNLKKFSSNGNNTNTITLEATTGLAVSNAVKIMSSTQPVLSATISGISGNNVTLNIVVPNTYKVSECARLVKQN